MRSAFPKRRSALLKYWISIIKCWFAWFLMMSFLPVFTVEIWRYYTVIGGPNNRLTGNGKNRVGNTSYYCSIRVVLCIWQLDQDNGTMYYHRVARCPPVHGIVTVKPGFISRMKLSTTLKCTNYLERGTFLPGITTSNLSSADEGP
jgi:hypothetical protein